MSFASVKYSGKISYYKPLPEGNLVEKLTVTTKCWLCCLPSRGDQILEVNSVNVRHAALSKVHAILSKCPPGPVRLVIGRHPNPKVKYFILFRDWKDGLAVCPVVVTHIFQWWHISIVTQFTQLGMSSSLWPHRRPYVYPNWYTWEMHHQSGLLCLYNLRKFYWALLTTLLVNLKFGRRWEYWIIINPQLALWSLLRYLTSLGFCIKKIWEC